MSTKQLVTIIVTVFITLMLVYLADPPMSRSQAHSIINKRGFVIYNKDMLSIGVPQYPSIEEIEAIEILAKASDVEGLHISAINPQ